MKGCVAAILSSMPRLTISFFVAVFGSKGKRFKRSSILLFCAVFRYKSGIAERIPEQFKLQLIIGKIVFVFAEAGNTVKRD